MHGINRKGGCMYELDRMALDAIHAEHLQAAEYARKHYKELAKRKHTYTLYGGDTYCIGVQIPSRFIHKSGRKLLKSTRREKYTAYELDENYHVIRTFHMLEHGNRIDCIYHHFELNGFHYAYPFRGDTGDEYTGEIAVLKHDQEGKPACFALVSKYLLVIEFYTYSSADSMLVSTYHYHVTAETSYYGFPIDLNAPINAENSNIVHFCNEQKPHFVDFFQYFKQ